jgi:hypothetical protein
MRLRTIGFRFSLAGFLALAWVSGALADDPERFACEQAGKEE